MSDIILTTKNYEQIKQKINVESDELAWQKVAWRDGYFAGLQDAQKADKPIFLWIYEGDPRGGC